MHSHDSMGTRNSFQTTDSTEATEIFFPCSPCIPWLIANVSVGWNKKKGSRRLIPGLPLLNAVKQQAAYLLALA
jgi:hypothetical protein